MLLKIYGFLIVLSLLVSNSLLKKEHVVKKPITASSTIVTHNDQPEESSSTPDTSEATSSVAIASTTPISNIPEIKKVATFVTTVTPTKTQITPQTTEIDSSDSDAESGILRPNPCKTPIVYNVGSFDTRFGISKNYFLETITQAVTLWNDAAGKKLFIYSDKKVPNGLTINLIYDNRQKITDDNKLLGDEIQNTKKAALVLQEEYESMKATFSNLKDTYTNRVAVFNERQKKYEEKVAYWNSQGGAPQGEYDVLTEEKDYLKTESDAITNDHDSLNAMLVDINAKIDKHNELVAFANEKVAQNNSQAQKKFTEGRYSAGSNEISIYQFNDTIKLQRVLTHELGHALGLDHTKDSQSIMYAINSATTTTLQHDDIQALMDVCTN
jgi:hypothetical protein